jgi:hypothetical protein
VLLKTDRSSNDHAETYAGEGGGQGTVWETDREPDAGHVLQLARRDIGDRNPDTGLRGIESEDFRAKRGAEVGSEQRSQTAQDTKFPLH